MNAVGKNVPIGGPAAGKTTVFGMVQRGAGKGKSRARAFARRALLAQEPITGKSDRI